MSAVLDHIGRPIGNVYDATDVHQYGAVGDGVTDDTAAIMAAYAATGASGGAVLSFEARTYNITQLDFTGAINLRLIGKHGGSVATPNPSEFAGATVLRSTATSGPAILLDDAGYTAHSIVAEDILFWAATNGPVIYFENVAEIFSDRCMVVNDGNFAGAKGLHLARCYYIFCDGVRVLKSAHQMLGTGVLIDMTGASDWLGGLHNFKNCSIQSWQTGLSVGDPSPSAANENYANVNFIGSELLANEVGSALQHGVKGALFDGAYIEANTSIGIFVTLGASGVSVRSSFFNNYSAADADVRFGHGGLGDPQYQEFGNSSVEQCTFLAVKNAGVISSATGASKVRVINNHFTLGTSGAEGVNSNSTACRVEDNTYVGFSPGDEEVGTFA